MVSGGCCAGGCVAAVGGCGCPSCCDVLTCRVVRIGTVFPLSLFQLRMCYPSLIGFGHLFSFLSEVLLLRIGPSTVASPPIAACRKLSRSESIPRIAVFCGSVLCLRLIFLAGVALVDVVVGGCHLVQVDPVCPTGECLPNRPPAAVLHRQLLVRGAPVRCAVLHRGSSACILLVEGCSLFAPL